MGARASPGRRPTAPTTSGGRSTNTEPAALPPDHLSGPVDVCIAVPSLSLDRPFTYRLRSEDAAGTGSLVSVPFHGRPVRGWVLGTAAEVPAGRVLPVRRVHGPVRFFDSVMLELLRWVGERYLAPLSTVIDRSYPPRVVSEDRGWDPDGSPSLRGSPIVLGQYGAGRLEPGTSTWLRPLPQEEVHACLAAVEACRAAGLRALVLVPEADPLPATAGALLDRFGDRAAAFLGGDPRQRYRRWLEIKAGAYDVVVGTRPAVFAPLRDLGLIWVSREVHPGHREERAPYYHVRDVASARARIQQAACVLAAFAPSVATAAAVSAGRVRVARPTRAVERAAGPLVETSPPEGEDRSTRLMQLLRGAGSAALIVSRRGYGVARVCRSCKEPAACALCHGPIVLERGRMLCRVCRAEGRCGSCGGTAFGVERGGAERIAEWARHIAGLPVDIELHGRQPSPRPGRLLVGTAAAVDDVGPRSLDLVAILDPDRALARAGLHSGEQALATWMEAASWAAPRERGGRVLAQTRRPGHRAIQALIRWEPLPFLLAEAARRTESGFPPDHPVFRVLGTADLPEALRAGDAGRSVLSLLTTTSADRTLCLVAVRPAGLAAFRELMIRLVGRGVVTRVEAEPQL